MKTLFILNEAAYGSERTYNALRLAGSLSKKEDMEVKLFLLGDASTCAKGNQKVPQGYYNVELMLKTILNHNGEIGVCGTCMDARGIAAEELLSGAHRSTLEELTAWTLWAEKLLVF